ncbi:hypothetical protein SAOR_13840 [Salinisphaera orenii MK-B5]|uniref:Lytic transglycosylase n=1 Tax=Salinisphaera orenii MK-B5 TaxID=856730 RepID=A0A423PGP2_9GAMM|nr:transglycosylase SLT domain-containing protein [Salinisphaera orenii]ROO24734.1 hypothetical protein SAOR_13840 [Salinisphaera orenii MK-B5]
MRVLLIAALVGLAGTAAATTPAQRSLFLDTLAAAEQGRLDETPAARRQLENYPLHDYLTAADLSHRLRTDASAALDRRIDAFVTAHPDLPPARALRGRWLASLTRRERWDTLLAAVDTDADGTANRCRAVHARIARGGEPATEALELWRVGHSQPDACDPVFAWLEDSGRLSADEILLRARLALLEGHFGLVRYLGRKLPEDRAARTDRWLDVAQNPERLASAGPLDTDVAVYVFKRLALRDLDAATDLYPRLVERLNPDAAQQYEMKRYLALLYAQNHESEALAWFARLDHARMDAHELGWEIRAAIYQQRWPLVIEAIHDLPPELADEEEWRYWQARALAETGDDEAARARYQALARERSYHGYLAADALGLDYSLNERPLAPDTDALARLRAQPALARAEELRALGMDHQAGREWNVLVDRLDGAALGQAARVAHDWGWHIRAITTLAKADYWDDLDIRYPTPFRDAVATAADRAGIDPAYAYAIIRTESLFQPAVRSPAGAIGLMQLMPGTARLVARQNGEPTPSTTALTDPATNARLGTRYLRDMLDRWHGNLALATASYNAGPNRIARWLPAESMDPAIWIANIPYTETRKYVQRAMSHMTVFQQRLTESIVPLAERLDPIRPRYADDDTAGEG